MDHDLYGAAGEMSFKVFGGSVIAHYSLHVFYFIVMNFTLRKIFNIIFLGRVCLQTDFLQKVLGCTPKYSKLYDLNISAVNSLLNALDDFDAQLWDDNTFVVLMIDNLQQLSTKQMRKHRLFESDRFTPLQLTSPIASHVGQLKFKKSPVIDALSNAQHDMNCSPRIIFSPHNIKKKLFTELMNVPASTTINISQNPPADPDPPVSSTLDFISLSSEEADIMKGALHEFISFAFALREANGTTIGDLLENADKHLPGEVETKKCLTCDGLNERLPSGRFPIFCRLADCEGRQVRQSLTHLLC